MSYGGYNQGGGYGQGNPYDQRDDGYGAQGGYNAGGYQSGGYQRQNDVEMQPLSGQQGGYSAPPAGRDENAILNTCRDIDRSIDQIESQLEQLERTYRRAAGAPDQYRGEIDDMSASIMTSYRSLVERVKKVKSQPESGNPRNAPQVGRVDRKLKATINRYQNLERDYRKEVQAQAERQYRIVRPDASDDEVRQATENPEAPIFQQALMQSDRRGQATSVLNNVRARHEEIQRIEQQMIELAQLFQDLDQIVMEQEPMVAQIEQKAEEAHDNVVKGNIEIDGAIDKARSARRKKWWCLLIVVIILIIIAIVVAIVVTQVIPKNNNNNNGNGQ